MKKLLHYVMQGLLLVGAVLAAPASLMAQTYPPNDSCNQATVLPVLNNVVYGQYLYRWGRIEAGGPINSSCVQPLGNPRGDVWYQATITTQGLILRLKKDLTYAPPLFEIYHGDCGHLVLDTCNNWYGGVDSALYLFDFPPGTTAYIRFISYAANQNVASPIYISAQAKPTPKRVISKRVTGNWQLNSSWVGEVAPTFNDTVVIDDGATITVLAQQLTQVGKLIVGQADTNLTARLNVSLNNAQPAIADSLVINRGDTLDLITQGRGFYLYGNVRIDGGLKTQMPAALAFVGSGKQVLEGSGKLIALPHSQWFIYLNKPDTLVQKFALDIKAADLNAGTLLCQAPIRFYANATDVSPSPTYMFLERGEIVNPQLSCHNAYNGTFTLYLYDPDQGTLSGADSAKHINRYFIEGTKTILILNRNPAYPYIAPGNKVLHQIGESVSNYGFQGLFKTGEADTVFAGCSYNLASAGSGFVTGTFVYNPALAPAALPDTCYFPFVHQGLQRQLSLSNAKALKAPNQTLTVSVLNQGPSGPVGGSLNAVQGSFVFKINSNLDTLPAPCKLRFYYTPADSLKGTPYNYRIAQSHSPNGPWYSVSPTFGAANSNSVTTTDMLSFDNGTYFCFATLDYLGVPAQAATRQPFTLYPNPATHTVNITALPSQSAPLFYNTVGQLLQVPLQSKPGLWQADVQSLPKGLYLVYYAGQVSKVVKE